VSRLVDDLCADGLALRAKHPVDGRSVLLADTRSGARLAIVLARAALAVTACGNAAGHRQAEDAERGAEVRPFDLEA
jgi:DNA-binding MarR family transcriptional regulator